MSADAVLALWRNKLFQDQAFSAPGVLEGRLQEDRRADTHMVLTSL